MDIERLFMNKYGSINKNMVNLYLAAEVCNCQA